MRIQFNITVNDKIVAFCRKVFNAKTIIVFIAVSLFTAGLFIFAGEFDFVHTFESGEIISSSQVNKNFQDLADRTLGSISDVDAEGVTTGKVLKYNESTSSWEIADDEGGVAGSSPWHEGSSGIIYYNLGNVGIKTATPGYDLDVNGTINAEVIRLGGVEQTTWPSGGNCVWTVSENDIYWNGNGNIGIKTIDPAYTLDIAGTARISDNVGIGTFPGIHRLAVLGFSNLIGGVGIHGTLEMNDQTITNVHQINHVRGMWNLYNNGNATFTGNVSIGTTSSDAPLDVFGRVRIGKPMTGGPVLGDVVYGLNNLHIQNKETGDPVTGTLYLNHYVSDNVIIATGGGKVGVNTVNPNSKLAVAGLTGTSSYNHVRVNIATGDFYYDSSTIRNKENVQDFHTNFDSILKINPKSYTDKSSQEPEIGYIAEELDQLGLSDLVIYDDKDLPNGIKYERITLYLIEVLKEMKVEIEELKSGK